MSKIAISGNTACPTKLYKTSWGFNLAFVLLKLAEIVCFLIAKKSDQTSSFSAKVEAPTFT